MLTKQIISHSQHAWRRLITVTERWALECPLRFSIGMTLVLFAAVFTFFTSSFQTNDDVVMAMISSGTGIGLTPDEHLVFTNVLIGWMLKGLYQMAGDVPWYGLYLIGVHFIAHTAVLYSLITWRYFLRHAQMFYLYFSVVGLYLLVNLQFTTTAFLAAQSGLIIGLTALCRRSEQPEYRTRRLLAAAAGLVLIGALIRIDSCVAAVAIVTPAALYMLWKINQGREGRQRTWRPAIITALGATTIIGACQVFNSQYYACDPPWRDFIAYNALRLKFNDYQWTSYNEETRAVFDRVHWSENDHAMLVNWFFDDAQIFSAQNLQSALEGYPWAEYRDRNNLIAGWRQILHDKSVWPLLMLLPLVLCVARNRTSTLLVMGITLVTAAALLSVVMLLLKEPPARVYYPAMAFPMMLGLLAMRRERTTPAREQTRWFVLHAVIFNKQGKIGSERVVMLDLTARWLLRAIMIMLVVGVSINDYRQYRRGRGALKLNRTMKTALAQLDPHDEELYVCWGSVFPYESLLPLDRPSVLRNFHMLSLGWPQQSPLHHHMKEHFQITDVSRAICEQPSVFLISNEWLNAMLAMYAQEHFQMAIDWEGCYRTKTFSVWKPNKIDLDGAALAPDNVDTETAKAVGARSRPY